MNLRVIKDNIHSYLPNRLILSLVIAVFLIAQLSDPLLGAGWYWSLGNGLGFVGVAGLLYLAVDTRKGSKIRAHQLISYGVVAAVFAHTLWFLLGDFTTLEYLKIGAPAYMWSGLLALLLLTLLTVIALPSVRRATHSDHAFFRRWHLWLSVGVVCSMLYHIVGSGFYLEAWFQWMLLLLLVLASYLLPVYKSKSFRTASLTAFITLGLVATLLFAGIRNIAL